VGGEFWGILGGNFSPAPKLWIVKSFDCYVETLVNGAQVGNYAPEMIGLIDRLSKKSWKVLRYV